MNSRPTVPVYSPSQLIERVNELLASALPRVVVEGEIASLRASTAGHLYFELRDATAVLPCALFARERRALSIAPAEGRKVQATGRLSVYPGSGRFQLIVERLTEAGEGELLRAFLALKAKLEAEGLFDPKRKPPLPRWPQRLALLTSPEGAVRHDVLTILARRFPLLPIEIHPVPVQGRDAAPAIVAALHRVVAAGRCDLVLIARGGGSLSDLAPFNDEALARAIADSPLPVVSAIGHETDYTIADFVATLRAPTPSAAAEMIVPDAAELARRLEGMGEALRRETLDRLRARQQRLDELDRMLRAFTPSHGPLAAALAHRRTRLAAAMRARLAAWRHRLDPGLARLLSRRGTAFRRHEATLARCGERLLRSGPLPRLGELRWGLQALHARLRPPLPALTARLLALAARLRELHPRRRLALWRRRLEAAPLSLLLGLRRVLAACGRSLPVLRERLARREPRLRLVAPKDRLERAGFRLRRAPAALLASRIARAQRSAPAALRLILEAELRARRERLEDRRTALAEAWRERSAALSVRARQAALGIERLGPRATLRRGYAILLDAEGGVVSRAAQASAGQPLAALLADGSLDLRVERSRRDADVSPMDPRSEPP